jgi:drug/metabolite transporter (DMT)-like permease
VTALALALASSLCWGVSDFMGGLQSRRHPLLVVLFVTQAVGLTGLLVLLAVRGVGPPEFVRLLPAAGAGIAGLAGLGAFYRALAIGTMSIVAPVAATSVVFPVIVGVAGGDRPAVLQVAGVAAAIAGVILATREQVPAGEDRAQGRASIVLALMAAVGFGSFFVGLRISARADVPWALLAARVSGLVCLVAVMRVRRVTIRGIGGSLLPLALIGALDLSANGLFAVASRHGLLSLVAVGASLYPLATILLARVVLGERVRRLQEVGIATAIVGVALIAAG